MPDDSPDPDRAPDRAADRALDQDPHDLGLQSDLRALIGRRRALGLIAALGAAPLLSACDGPPGEAQPNRIGVAEDGSRCIAQPQETAGPYPADGSNRAHGELANALRRSGVVREDMRTGFGGLGGEADGVPLDLTLTLLDVDGACAALFGHAVYLWHCDAEGKYSIYDRPETNYLRAVGVTDSQGQTTFRTIFPGCYDGRYPHMHFEVYPSLGQATDHRNRLLTSQIALPAALCGQLYQLDPRYRASLAAFARASLERDNVFGDNTSEQLAAQTPNLRGNPSDGFEGVLAIGLARPGA